MFTKDEDDGIESRLPFKIFPTLQMQAVGYIEQFLELNDWIHYFFSVSFSTVGILGLDLVCVSQQ